MSSHLIINGREITSPFLKFAITLGAVIAVSAMAALVVFILLPVIGVAVTLSAGFFVVFMIALIIGLGALAIGTGLFAWLFGPAEIHIHRHRRRD